MHVYLHGYTDYRASKSPDFWYNNEHLTISRFITQISRFIKKSNALAKHHVGREGSCMVMKTGFSSFLCEHLYLILLYWNVPCWGHQLWDINCCMCVCVCVCVCPPTYRYIAPRMIQRIILKLCGYVGCDDATNVSNFGYEPIKFNQLNQ